MMVRRQPHDMASVGKETHLLADNLPVSLRGCAKLGGQSMRIKHRLSERTVIGSAQPYNLHLFGGSNRRVVCAGNYEIGERSPLELRRPLE
jgi:hypothetical protein